MTKEINANSVIRPIKINLEILTNFSIVLDNFNNKTKMKMKNMMILMKKTIWNKKQTIILIKKIIKKARKTSQFANSFYKKGAIKEINALSAMNPKTKIKKENNMMIMKVMMMIMIAKMINMMMKKMDIVKKTITIVNNKARAMKLMTNMTMKNTMTTKIKNSIQEKKMTKSYLNKRKKNLKMKKRNIVMKNKILMMMKIMNKMSKNKMNNLVIKMMVMKIKIQEKELIRYLNWIMKSTENLCSSLIKN